jgi:hypothetical protein
MVASWDQKLSTNNSREQNTNQESTETNQQQPTDITQKITNAQEQPELPMNLHHELVDSTQVTNDLRLF